MKRHYIIIFSMKKIADDAELEKDIASHRQMCAEFGGRIICYGVCATGKNQRGQDVAGCPGYVLQIDADGLGEIADRMELSKFSNKWAGVVKSTRAATAAGNLGTWGFDLQKQIDDLGRKYGVAYLRYPDEPGKKVFTYGDRAGTVAKYAGDMAADAEKALRHVDVSGTGVPAEFAVREGSVTFAADPDGRTRLCLAVHVKAKKGDYEDSGLQRRINGLRKDIAFRYGVEIDIVDVRSTIEYA